MYFLCTIHPELVETQEKDYVGEWMTMQEKRQAIDQFYGRRQDISISFNHTAKKEYGSFIPHEHTAGKILDLFCDADGDMIAKCYIPRDNPAFKQLNQAVHLSKQTWGVSPRIDFCLPEGYGGPIVKTLTHVALTQTPLMADKGTFIHHWATNEQALNHTINREYFTEGQERCYAAKALTDTLSKLKGVINFVSSSHKFSSFTHTLTPLDSHDIDYKRPEPASSSLSPSQQQTRMTDQSNQTTNGALPEQQQQQQQQQQDVPQQKQETTLATVASSSSSAQQQGGNNNNNGDRIDFEDFMQMQKELSEMESLLVDVPLQSMKNDFKMKYLNQMTKVDRRADDMINHIDALVQRGRLRKQDAEGYKSMIRNSRHEPDNEKNDLKRPIFGFVEASLEDNRDLREENRKIFEQQKKRTQIMLEEKEQMTNEMESLKKKVKANEYLETNGSALSLRDRFGNELSNRYSSNNNNNSPAPSGKTFNLLDSARMLTLTQGGDVATVTESYTRREPVDLHMRSQYDHVVQKNLNTDLSGAESYNRLMKAAVSLL